MLFTYSCVCSLSVSQGVLPIFTSSTHALAQYRVMRGWGARCNLLDILVLSQLRRSHLTMPWWLQSSTMFSCSSTWLRLSYVSCTSTDECSSGIRQNKDTKKCSPRAILYDVRLRIEILIMKSKLRDRSLSDTSESLITIFWVMLSAPASAQYTIQSRLKWSNQTTQPKVILLSLWRSSFLVEVEWAYLSWFGGTIRRSRRCCGIRDLQCIDSWSSTNFRNSTTYHRCNPAINPSKSHHKSDSNTLNSIHLRILSSKHRNVFNQTTTHWAPHQHCHVALGRCQK